MSPRLAWLSGLVVMVLVVPGSRAEVPDLKPQRLKSKATHIVLGKLRAVYRSVERGGDFEQTRGVAEILVDEVEKGVGLKAGEVVFVRFWNSRWVGQGERPTYSHGHRMPSQGAVVRAYVERGADGTYEVLFPNGVAIAVDSADRPN